MTIRARPLAGLALAVGLLGVSAVSAQRLHVDTYTVVNGLPSSVIHEIGQDASGRLWVLTRSGVVSYDGWQWATLDLPRQDLVRGEEGALAVGPGGEIWLVLVSETLNLLQVNGERVFTADIPEHLAAGRATGLSLAVAGDSDDPIIAIGTSGHGLLVHIDGQWTVLRAPTDLPSDRINDVLAIDRRVLVATDRGVCWLDSVATTCLDPKLAGAPNSHVVALAKTSARGGNTSREEIFLAGATWAGELVDGQIQLKTAAGAFDLHLPAGKTSMTIGPDGSIYLGTSQRAFRVDIEHGGATPLGPAQGLAAVGATSLFTDREGNVWVGSLRGLSKIVPDRFASFTAEHGLLEDEVSAVAELPSGAMVFGHNLGLTFFEDGLFRTIAFAARESMGADSVRVMDLDVDADGSLWVAASRLGAGRMGRDGDWTWYSEHEGVAGPANSILCLEGATLVGTSGGLYQRADEELVFAQVDLPEGPVGVRRIIAGPDRTIYVATSERGIFIRRQGRWGSARHPQRRGANLVTAVYTDPSGEVMAGTDVGVFGLARDSLVDLDEPWSGISNPIFFMVRDREGTLWLGTDHGLLAFNGDRLWSFDAQHSLAGNETNRAAGFIDSTGRLWVGTDGGVSFRAPGALSRNLAPPIAVLLGAQTPDGVLHPLLETLKLPYTDHTLVFRFRGIAFIKERQLRFKARLVGHDTTWLGPAELTEAGLRYTNIPPGDYTFEVQVENVNGVWSEVVSSAPMTIQAPFWQQSWFLAAALGLTLLICVAFFRHFQQRYRMAFVDGLTGLANRAAMSRRIGAALAKIGQGDGQVALMLLDLDRFRHINSSLGHRAGDDVLVQTGRRLANAIPDGASLARVGSDEFAVLLTGDPSAEGATATAEALQQELAHPFVIEGFEAYLGASAGITVCADRHASPLHLLRDADAALHHAKNAGPRATVVFDDSMHTENLQLLTLESELKKALARRQLTVHYQPLFNLAAGNLAGFEALVRWQHPVHGMLCPADFLPIAEATGLIVEIGNWVLEQSCRQLAAWRTHHESAHELIISVNLSSRQVADSDLVQTISTTLQSARLPADALKLELTEDSIMGSDPEVVSRLSRLRRHDLGVWVDDFGTGYSSLSYLQKLPIDALKIDRSFVLGLNGSNNNPGIVDTILSLGRNLGLTVVAEGIESEEQLTRLRDLGCNLGQGNHLGRPMPADEVETRYFGPND